MTQWDRAGIPQKGWKHLRIEDLRDSISEGQVIRYEECEMCKNTRIRFVHVLKHQEYPYELRVGCECAEKMTDSYNDVRKKEREIRNRSNRRMVFLNREWLQNQKTGNYYLCYKKIYITILRSTYDDGFGVICQGNCIWKYRGKKICDIESAKLAAFDLYEEITHTDSF